MAVTIAGASPATLGRTAQLTQKTNQFNLTTRRYSEQELGQLLADGSGRVYTVSSRDRFGDNGQVGVAIVRISGSICEIDTLLLSCRVIGRTIETALLATLASEARAAGARLLVGEYVPTKKNAPSRDFYASHGFTCDEPNDGATRWELDLNRATVTCPDWIECHLSESPEYP